MNLKIKIKNKKVEIDLLNKSKLADRLIIIEDRNLSEKLLPSIDKLLKKNKISLKSVKRINTKNNVSDNFTTFRIVQSVAKNWNFGAQKRRI